MKPQTLMHKRLLTLREDVEAPSAAPSATSIDSQLLELLLAPLGREETAAAGHDRKEREIGALLATLRPIDAWTLHRRLASPRDDDPLALAFQRLIATRRARLLAFLGDAKRRAAVTHALASRDQTLRG